jgi:hypothetical protein
LVSTMDICSKQRIPVLCGQFQSNCLSLMPVMAESPYATEYAVTGATSA